jgi:hypothetical protein
MKALLIFATLLISQATFACWEQFTGELDFIIIEKAQKEVKRNGLIQELPGGELCRNKRLIDVFKKEEGSFTFQFFINRDLISHGLLNAKQIAGFLIKKFGIEPTKMPKPCGLYSKGKYKHKSKKNAYYILGQGEGLYDSCLGLGSPGHWIHHLKVTYNKEKNSGVIELFRYFE